MASKKLTDFTVQSPADYSSFFYVVPSTGPNAFTDMRVSLTTLFNAPTFTGVVAMTGSLNVTGGISGGTLSGNIGLIGGDTITTNTAVQTLTNKTLTSPIFSTIVNTGTLTLPTSTDTLVGRATTDTLTNKTLTSPTINAGALSGTFSGTPTYSGNVTFTSTITPSQTAGIVGTTTNNNAQAGSVGEYQTILGSPVSLTSGSAIAITSLSLTAGDWEVFGSVYFSPAGSTTIQYGIGGLNTVTATIPGNTHFFQQHGSSTAGLNMAAAVPSQRLSLSTTTTVFLNVLAGFSISTMTATGEIRARRVR